MTVVAVTDSILSTGPAHGNQFLKLLPTDNAEEDNFDHTVAIRQPVAYEVGSNQAIGDHWRRRLDIEPHEATDGGQNTLLVMKRQGAGQGEPCALVNNDRHECLTIEMIDQIQEGLA